MKRNCVILVIVVTMTSFVLAEAAFAGRAGKRQVRQQKRIHQGVRSGEVTKKEFRRLEKEQRHIQRSKRRALSDGELTGKERLRLDHKQDRASRHIYRAKHNDHDRD